MLNSTIWDILEGKRLAVKNIKTGEIYFVDASYLIVATGAVPFMPSFGNDDLPGVYTAAVVQKMMNQEFTLLGKNILTVGAGNIGYLTSYQLMQAGAHVKAIIEAMPNEGGFPVQANRVRRLGIPVILSHILVKAIPNATVMVSQVQLLQSAETLSRFREQKKLLMALMQLIYVPVLPPTISYSLKAMRFLVQKSLVQVMLFESVKVPVQYFVENRLLLMSFRIWKQELIMMNTCLFQKNISIHSSIL